jgi:hypothetical protein
MLKVTVSGQAKEGKSTILAIISKALNKYGYTTNIKDKNELDSVEYYMHNSCVTGNAMVHLETKVTRK